MSIYARKYIGFICNSYALYDFDMSSKGIQEWFNYVLMLSEKFGYPFTEGAVTPGNTKMVLFKNCKRTFDKNVNNIKDISLRHLLYRDDENLPSGGEIVQAYLFSQKKCMFGAYDIFLDNFMRLEIGINLCIIMRPKYAFLYKFPFVFSPWTYVSGMTNTEYDNIPHEKYYNEKHVDIRKRISSWHWHDNKQKICEQGFLREIYPLNFINENHLDHEIFPKTTLKDWIKAADHRGTLEKATDELWLWAVPDEDLEFVTKELAMSDILLCVNKENPQRYDYGVRPEDQVV
jgi:hypothetical protein